MKGRPEDPDDEDTSLGFFSYLFMAIGFLICTLSGTCMLVVIVNGFRSGSQVGFSNLVLALLFGAIPFALGLMMFFVAKSK